MTVWQWLTKTLPLENERDVMARIGFRFIWCTVPYFLLMFVLSAFGITVLFSPALALMILFLPIIGGVADWRRLQRRRGRAAVSAT
jgi:hypothetical protein